MYRFSIFVGKSVSSLSRALSRGAGSTWPGHIALKIDSKFVRNILHKNPNLKIVLVAGTNGKTTTAKLIQEVLEENNIKAFRNSAGANLLNGIASSLIKHSGLNGKINYDVAIFEIDENSLPIILSELSHVNCHMSIVLLNLFRDQLDRYGEVNTIAKHWLQSLKSLTESSNKQGSTLSTHRKGSTLIINGDDPMLSYIGNESGLKTFYFGLDQKLMKKKEAPHDVDFIYCPNCGSELIYPKRSYSHMGLFKCPKCSFKHSETQVFDSLPNPMFGIYNKYNINAAALLLNKVFRIKSEQTKKILEAFAPAFGRQEKIEYKGKNIFLLLSKNPTGFNQSIYAILEQDKTPNVLLLLNDRIPDGRDISWIWDVDTEELTRVSKNITISGDRCFDMGLRIKYSSEFPISNSQFQMNFQVKENLKKAINMSLEKIKENETLYVLATYSAMLEVRKILKGRSIL